MQGNALSVCLSKKKLAKSVASRTRELDGEAQVLLIASRLSRAKIKCSICSSQFNTWDAQHRWALVLIVCLNRGRRFKARFVAPTGCPGIAVPPGSAHARHWRVSFLNRIKYKATCKNVFLLPLLKSEKKLSCRLAGKFRVTFYSKPQSVQEPQDLNELESNISALRSAPTHTYLTRVYTVIT